LVTLLFIYGNSIAVGENGLPKGNMLKLWLPMEQQENSTKQQQEKIVLANFICSFAGTVSI